LSSINKVILIGNVGQAPELKTTTSGHNYLRFSLATTEYWKDKSTGQRKDQTTWHNIKVYEPQASSLLRLIKKGSKLYIEGSIRTSEYEKNGQKVIFTEILSRDVKLLDKLEPSYGEQAPQVYAPNLPKGPSNLDFLDDEVPF
jgi:single-strand DNA-binding protein